ncbi:hypothetical protein [Jiulongibacter sediminis]|uniref:hypothetical protein n=1 Tax=Jiulongibacter sediminis TaxID=1605367 RepID=UPI0026EA01F2|nr:hypothetical protein [Jiulongibacter sediminis]
MLHRFFEFIHRYPLSPFESFCVLLPLIIGLLRWEYFYRYLKIIWLVCLVYLLLDIPLWHGALLKQNNYYWANIQEIAVSWILILSFLWLKERPPVLLIVVCMIFSTVTAIYNFKFDTFSSWTKVIHRVIYIGLSFYFYFRVLNDLKVKNILHYPAFWIVSGMMLMACGTTLIFIFEEITVSYSNAADDVFFFYSNLIDVLKIIFTIMIGIGFWVSKYRFNE